MAPNSCHKSSGSRVWWMSPLTTKQKLIKYYNTVLVPKHNDFSIRELTKTAFDRIIIEMSDFNFFGTTNHFITKDRFVLALEKSIFHRSFAILCNECSTTDVGSLKHSSKHKLKGNEHFIFPRSMVLNILEIHSLWCDICDTSNFEWFTETDCPQCYV